MGTLILLLFSATILVAFQVKPSDLVINPDPTQPPKRDNKLTSSFINHTPLCDHVLHDKVFQVHAQHGKPPNAKFGLNTNLNAAALQHPRPSKLNTQMNIEFSMPAMSKLLSATCTSFDTKVAEASKLPVPNTTFFAREFRSWLPRLNGHRLHYIPEDRELDTTMDKILASSCRFGTPRASGPGFNQFPFLERIAKKTEVTPESNPSAPEPKPRRKPSSTLIKQPCNACIGSEEAPRRESTPEPIWPQSLEDVSFLLQDVMDTPEIRSWGCDA